MSKGSSKKKIVAESVAEPVSADSTEEHTVTVAKTNGTNGKAQKKTPAKKEEKKAPAATPQTKTPAKKEEKKTPAKKVEESSEESSEEVKEVKEQVKPKAQTPAKAVAKTPAKKVEESSDESSEEEEVKEQVKPKTQTPAKAVAKTPAKKVEESSDESSEEEEVKEEVKPKTQTPAKAVAKTPAKKEEKKVPAKKVESEDEDEEMEEKEEEVEAPKEEAKGSKRKADAVDDATEEQNKKKVRGISVVVRGLVEGVTEDEIKAAFSGPLSATIPRNFTGHAFVDFSSQEEAEAAVELSGKSSLGKGVTLEISRSRPRGESTTRILVRNLPVDADTESLKEALGEHGVITDLYIPREKTADQKAKSFAFVQFAEEDASNAFISLGSIEYKGVTLGPFERAAEKRRDSYRGGRGGGDRNGGFRGGRGGRGDFGGGRGRDGHRGGGGDRNGGFRGGRGGFRGRN